MNSPLADALRPQILEEVVGQPHLLTPGKALYNIIQSGQIPNMIFLRPFGSGEDHGGPDYRRPDPQKAVPEKTAPPVPPPI